MPIQFNKIKIKKCICCFIYNTTRLNIVYSKVQSCSEGTRKKYLCFNSKSEISTHRSKLHTRYKNLVFLWPAIVNCMPFLDHKRLRTRLIQLAHDREIRKLRMEVFNCSSFAFFCFRSLCAIFSFVCMDFTNSHESSER